MGWIEWKKYQQKNWTSCEEARERRRRKFEGTHREIIEKKNAHCAIFSHFFLPFLSIVEEISLWLIQNIWLRLWWRKKISFHFDIIQGNEHRTRYQVALSLVYRHNNFGNWKHLSGNRRRHLRGCFRMNLTLLTFLDDLKRQGNWRQKCLLSFESWGFLLDGKWEIWWKFVLSWSKGIRHVFCRIEA